MKPSWQSFTVQYFVDRGEADLRTGPFGTQLHASDYVDKGTPVINVRNIGYGNIREAKLEYLDQETVQRLSDHILETGDIVFGRKGAADRHVFIKPKHAGWFQGSDCLRLRLKSPLVDPKFASYSLLTDFHKRWMMNQCSHGATMSSLNQGIVKRIPLSLPPLPTQRKIAAILSAYDDLIENNTRRIQILEEMAQALYREWFVHFRFPGHEGVRMVEGMLEGWEVVPVSEAFEIIGGGTPSKKVPEYWEDGDINWYTPSDLTAADTMFMDSSSSQINALGLKKSSARLFPPYSVMMTSRATIGVVAINTTAACTNQGFITCIPNEQVSMYQLYFWLLENKDKFIGLASGATYKEIIKSVFKTIGFLRPPEATAQDFMYAIEPLGEMVLNLQRKNANLRQTRDMLLPKLVSGEVDVSGLEIEVSE